MRGFYFGVGCIGQLVEAGGWGDVLLRRIQRKAFTSGLNPAGVGPPHFSFFGFWFFPTRERAHAQRNLFFPPYDFTLEGCYHRLYLWRSLKLAVIPGSRRLTMQILDTDGMCCTPSVEVYHPWMSAFIRGYIWPVSSRVSPRIEIDSMDELIDPLIVLPHW